MSNSASALRGNGYEPVSLLKPADLFYACSASDDPAAIKTNVSYDHGVSALIVTKAALADPKRAEMVTSVLKEHSVPGQPSYYLDANTSRKRSDLRKAPYRTDAAGNRWYLVCYEHHAPFHQWMLNAPDGSGMWFGFECGPRVHESSLIPLSGTWTNGSPFDTPRAKLPLADSRTLYDALQRIVVDASPPAVPFEWKPDANPQRYPRDCGVVMVPSTDPATIGWWRSFFR